MSIEEQRKKWQEEKRRQANEKRKKEERDELEKIRETLKKKEQHRYKGNVFIYKSIVQAFGEEKAKELRWQSNVRLPLGVSCGDIAILDDLKFFEYGSSLCLLKDEAYMERLYADYYTPDIIFAGEEKLKNKIREDEIKRKETVLKKEHEERAEKRIEQEKSSLQEEVPTSWWQNFYISIKKYF